MKFEKCKQCLCKECPLNCKACDECEEDYLGYCKLNRELEENKQIELSL